MNRIPVNKYSRVIKNIDDCLSYFDEMNNLRNNIPYEIDGLVYRVNDFQYYKSLGFTSKSPKWAIAYKFKSQESLSQIEDVTFQVGRTGTITPVAELTPVNIGGVRVAGQLCIIFPRLILKIYVSMTMCMLKEQVT